MKPVRKGKATDECFIAEIRRYGCQQNPIESDQGKALKSNLLFLNRILLQCPQLGHAGNNPDLRSLSNNWYFQG